MAQQLDAPTQGRIDAPTTGEHASREAMSGLGDWQLPAVDTTAADKILGTPELFDSGSNGTDRQDSNNDSGGEGTDAPGSATGKGEGDSPSDGGNEETKMERHGQIENTAGHPPMQPDSMTVTDPGFETTNQNGDTQINGDSLNIPALKGFNQNSSEGSKPESSPADREGEKRPFQPVPTPNDSGLSTSTGQEVMDR